MFRTKRLFSTIPKYCSNCNLFDKNKQLCKINMLPAISNRKDENICGVDGKMFTENKHLQKYKTNIKYCFRYDLLGFIIVSPTVLFGVTPLSWLGIVFMFIGDYYFHRATNNFEEYIK